MTAKCLLGPRRAEQQEVQSPYWGQCFCWWGSVWGSQGMPGLPVSPLRAAGGFPLVSMGFGSSPWHAACLFWTPSEDENILSMAALSPSPLDQLLLAPRSHDVTPLGENALSCSTCFLLHSQALRTQTHLQELIWSNNKTPQPVSSQILGVYCPFICPELANEHCTGTLVIK